MQITFYSCLCNFLLLRLNKGQKQDAILRKLFVCFWAYRIAKQWKRKSFCRELKIILNSAENHNEAFFAKLLLGCLRLLQRFNCTYSEVRRVLRKPSQPNEMLGSATYLGCVKMKSNMMFMGLKCSTFRGLTAIFKDYFRIGFEHRWGWSSSEMSNFLYFEAVNIIFFPSSLCLSSSPSRFPQIFALNFRKMFPLSTWPAWMSLHDDASSVDWIFLSWRVKVKTQ